MDELIGGKSNREIGELIDDRETTAFPFPSVKPLLKNKCQNPKHENKHKGANSRLSMIRPERHDSITSSSSSSYNGASGDNYVSEITNTEKL